MKTSDFNYYLPKERIAQQPISPRDHSRLFILNRKTGETKHKKFYEIGDFLQPGDVLVLNNSKVIPARLLGRKKETGGKLEIFLLKRISPKTWEVLIGGHGRKQGIKVEFKQGLEGRVIKLPDGIWHFRFNLAGSKLQKIIKKIGQAPTPPYIKQKSNLTKYQTVYAQKEGSVAAPTAGFHFTKRLINQLKKKGIQFEYVTLHVGFGTFQPVKARNIKQHKMHPEFVEVNKEVITRLWQARKNGQRIIAVGTTSVRVLETVLSKKSKGGFRGWVDTFIYPGYTFKSTDAMITNFHLPESTLIMLVSAFAGRKNILKVYETAKRKKYRFYSFGDAMLLF